jgi:PrsW family intramembrane metalloprotease
VVILSVAGAVLLIAGFALAYRVARQRPGVPAAGWFPDPAIASPRSRLWDSRTWTPQVQLGPEAADRGRRFWGRWAWILLGTLVVLAVGGGAYRASGNVHVMAITSFLGMTGVCRAFYRFAARQLGLDDAIGIVEIVAVTAGAVLLIAANVNQALIDSGGIRLAAGLVGLVEESTKLLVPLGLCALGRYRDPRAGIGIGLAAGFGFAIAETTQYAYATASASGPNFCGDEVAAPTAASVLRRQRDRLRAPGAALGRFPRLVPGVQGRDPQVHAAPAHRHSQPRLDPTPPTSTAAGVTSPQWRMGWRRCG